MKHIIGTFIIFVLVLSVLIGSVSAVNEGMGTGQGTGDGIGNGSGDGTPADDDNDGIPNKDDPDYVKTYQNQDNRDNDDDGDGIPNGQDDDFVPSEDGIIGTQASTKNMNTLKNQVNSMKQANNDLSEEDQGVKNANAGIQGLKIMNQYSNSTTSQKVSQIANNYEQKYQEALSTEEEINQRSGFSRLFFGGDEELANSLDGLIGENRYLIQELSSQLVDASEEEKTFILEQIEALQTECNRLETVAKEEANKKGLFRWW